jgi:transposase
MLLESKREQLTQRDDLRYTDVVIATLQCQEYEPWLKAALLHVPDSDIAYHMQEVDGLSSNGAQALTLQDIRDYQRMSARLFAAQVAAEMEKERNKFVPKPDMPHQPAKKSKSYMTHRPASTAKPLAPKTKHDMERTSNVYNNKGRVWATDPEYYSSRTVPQIAIEMGVSQEYTYKFLKRYGLAYKNQIATRISNGRTIDKHHLCSSVYPNDATWYQARTCKEAAAELKVSYSAMNNYATRHGLQFRTLSLSDINNAQFPYLPEWYAERTIAEISVVLGYTKDKVRHWLRSRGIAYKAHVTWAKTMQQSKTEGEV